MPECTGFGIRLKWLCGAEHNNHYRKDELARMSTPTIAFTFDVFLSHNAEDKPRVRLLAERLRAAGLRVWFDEWVIKPGDDIYLAIERGLEDARTLVLCLSPAALASD